LSLLDDIDGGKANETLKFGLDGTLYEIDLSTKHADKLRSALERYVSRATGLAVDRSYGPAAAVAAHPRVPTVSRTRPSATGPRPRGLDVSDRGRIPAGIVGQYQREAGR